MKALKRIALLSISFIIVCLSFSLNIFGQNVAINSSGAAPHKSAMLDIASTTQGVLIPRMTDEQRKNLKDPAHGLMIYNTTSKMFNFYNDKGWQRILHFKVSSTKATGTGPGLGTAINLSGNSPNPSSILDVSSTEKGFLLPRTTPNTITSPANGLIIYNTNTNSINYYNGSSWVHLSHNFIDNKKEAGASVGGVAINATGESAHESAMLDIKSTSKGVLFPRMTDTERNKIKSPAESLIIYNTSQNKFQSWTGLAWEEWGTDVITATGKIWMDRNLGASRVATSYNDVNAYGDLYQWGRFTDGHEKRTSTITNTLSTTNAPNHNKFITASTSPNDWRNPQNNNLWQGVNGINNPCPTGYRIPTAVELEAERASWNYNGSAGAMHSPLKLPTAGHRDPGGYLDPGGTYSDYWSSTTDGTQAKALNISSNSSAVQPFERVRGFSVRCIKD